MAPNPLLRSRSTAKKAFGAATGVSDPRQQGGFADWMDFSGLGFGRWDRQAAARPWR
jgi:hypothetical protein